MNYDCFLSYIKHHTPNTIFIQPEVSDQYTKSDSNSFIFMPR
jgi:hypothetical protein